MTGKLLAVVKAQKSEKKHVRTHIGVRHLQAGSSQKIDMAALNKLLTFFIGDIWQESPIPYPRMFIFDILVMVLQGLSTALMC